MYLPVLSQLSLYVLSPSPPGQVDLVLASVERDVSVDLHQCLKNNNNECVTVSLAGNRGKKKPSPHPERDTYILKRFNNQKPVLLFGLREYMVLLFLLKHKVRFICLIHF